MSTIGWVAVITSVLAMIVSVVSTALSVKWTREAAEARAEYWQTMATIRENTRP